MDVLESDVRRVADDEVGRFGLVVAQEKVSRNHPFGCEQLSRVQDETGLLEAQGHRLPSSGRVRLKEIEGADRGPEGYEPPVVRGSRLDQPVENWEQERPGAARRLDEATAAKVEIRRIADEIEDQLDDPPAGENLAVVGAGINGKLSDSHRLLEQCELSCHSRTHSRTQVRC